MNQDLIAYVNGEFIPFHEAALPLTDAGVVQGVIIIDRLRTFRQIPYRLEEHIARFRQSCNLAFVPQSRTDSELWKIIAELLAANLPRLRPKEEVSIVMLATPGSGDAPTLVVTMQPLDLARYRSLFTEGARLLSSSATISPEVLDPRIKHRSRLHWWIATHQMRQNTIDTLAHELLFTTGSPDRFVRETATANFLCCRDGTIIAPPRETILEGVSLGIVRELCQSLGIPFREEEVPIEMILKDPGECLLTNSTFCLAGVSHLDGHRLLWPGPMLQKLLTVWSKEVGVDFAIT